MPKIIYSIEDTFNTTNDGILAFETADKYFIPPYQRGFKWDSQVDKLLDDFYDAYDKNLPEYYLQNIVAKKTKNNVLELIDGQQRITTLCILFSVFNYIDTSLANFTANKLIYGIRDNVNDFFKKYLNGSIEKIINANWHNLINNDENLDEQDIYYLFNAIQKIYNFIDNLNEAKQQEFYQYIKDKVLIIYHRVDAGISSEKIFGNLNSNKLELTDVELVKGLLLTKTGRDIQGQNKNFKELIDKRVLLGRQWDEISIWLNRKDVKSFLFRNSDNSSLHDFLMLVVADDKSFNDEIKNPLFSYFDKKIKEKEISPIEVFNKIKLYYTILKEWFNNNEIYNLLSFIMFASDKKKQINSYINYIHKDKDKLKLELYTEAINSLPKIDDIEKLEYPSDRTVISKLLLALSIFVDEKTYRFNFYEFYNQKWSLEHIFPQTPKELSDNLGQFDISLLGKLLKEKDKIKFAELSNEEDSEEEIKNIYDNLKAKLTQSNCSINDKEKDFIYKFIKSDKLHSIGNLSLLTSSDNSSNSNGMFDKKRNNIVKRVSKGSFVPKHTYDVFSKLIIKNSSDLKMWGENDIIEHEKWIKSRVKTLKTKK